MKKKTSRKIFLHSSMNYPVIVRSDEVSGGYWVECPTFQGCYSQGKTIDESLENIKEAISMCVQEEPLVVRQTINTVVSLHFVQV